MAEFRPAQGDQGQFLEELFHAGLLLDTGVPGVYGRGETFESVFRAFDDLVTREAVDDGAEQLRFPPVLSRRTFENSGYLKSFPHLAGSVFGFDGTEDEAKQLHDHASRHGDWSEHQHMTDLVLAPAACYPIYPAVAERGPLSEDGATVDTGSAYVFRSEPSGDPARLQMFHQRELVRIGRPEQVAQWRDRWRDKSLDLLRSVGLEADFDVGADPFFGRAGRMLAASQREQALKFEILVPIAGPEPTAVASFNYHEDHFGSAFGLELADGTTAHTACLGFGMERVTLALLRVHGFDIQGWPDSVRSMLWAG